VERDKRRVGMVKALVVDDQYWTTLFSTLLWAISFCCPIFCFSTQ